MLTADPVSQPPASEGQSVSRLLGRMKIMWQRHIGRHLQSAEEAEHAMEKHLIGNIEDLVDLTAEDVMVPRVDILALEVNASSEEFLAMIRAAPHSRIPVYQDNLDDIVGFVHIKDVLRMMAQGSPIVLRELLRPVMIVSPAMPALDLLVEMRKTKKHLAMVIDEYGGIDGLATMGDLIEAIIGEIADEHNTGKAPRVVQRNDGTIVVDARYMISDFEKMFGECFDENERKEADTMGGLAMFLAGRLPQRGEILAHSSGILIEVIDADPRRVKRLRVRNLNAQEKGEAA
jgi:magnesium and cobalt transporter